VYSGKEKCTVTTVRRLEATYRRTRLAMSRASSTSLAAGRDGLPESQLMRSKEKNYWSRRTADSTSHPCRLFGLLRSLLRRTDVKPPFSPDEFAQFFHDKVQSRTRLDCCHRLKLNASKTEIIRLGTRQQLAELSQDE